MPLLYDSEVKVALNCNCHVYMYADDDRSYNCKPARSLDIDSSRLHRELNDKMDSVCQTINVLRSTATKRDQHGD